MRRFEIISSSPEETKEIARKLAKETKVGDIILLVGELGAGKTVFSKGFCSYFSVPEEEVSSPSFTLVNIYYGSEKIYHLDLYRIENPDKVDLENFLEYIEDPTAIKLIEWNKITFDVTFNVFKVEIIHLSEKRRKIIIEKERGDSPISI